LLCFITLNDTHTHTRTHMVGLLWTRDLPVAETSTWQHTTFTRDIHTTGSIRTRNPSKRAVEDPCLSAATRIRGYFFLHHSLICLQLKSREFTGRYELNVYIQFRLLLTF
jgi:hypothetical protein